MPVARPPAVSASRLTESTAAAVQRPMNFGLPAPRRPFAGRPPRSPEAPGRRGNEISASRRLESTAEIDSPRCV